MTYNNNDNLTKIFFSAHCILPANVQKLNFSVLVEVQDSEAKSGHSHLN